MKELITKINDRNIQRKRESGLTGYVLISALAICLYKLFNHVEFLLTDSIFEKTNLNKSIELICYTFNVLVSAGVITYQLFPNLKTLNHIKFIKRVKADPYILISMFLTFSIGTILISYLLLTKENPQSGFYLYCIIIVLMNIFGWFAFIQLIRNNNSNTLKINFEPQKLKNLILIFTLLISFIIAIISVFFIYNLEIEYKSQIIKIIILSYFSYTIIEKILEVNSNDLFYSKLEAYEYEIKLRNITDNDLIKREFQERFSGFLVNDWINNQIKLAEFRNQTFVENIEQISSQITEINNKLV
ncbi:hypothetical protein [Chryseobacterium balustinum]|uniref:hypothetical protein n=1 Tax=Chryseobacterium balustinum TaxID=246 RepID=UPI003CEFF506